MMMPRCALLVLAGLLVLAHVGYALDNGLGRLPGLGWNSDYCVGCKKTGDNGFQNEKFVKEIADFMHGVPLPSAGGKTLQDLGYRYVNMDASWDLKNRDAQGNLVPDPALWPSGLKYTIDYVHSLGLGFGLYGDRGTTDCAGLPGAEGHETADAEFMAAYEVDWYKEDSCAAPQDEETAITQYELMRDALNKSGRPIWFALCGWHTWYASDPRGGKKLGNSARIGPDTGPGGWISIMANALGGASVSSFAGPTSGGGYWNDGCLQLIPGLSYAWDAAHNITNDRHRSQFSMWCMLAMNILLTGNFSSLDPYVIQTWTNTEVLAIDQDALGIPAFLLAQNVTPGESYSSMESAATANGRANDYPRARVAECGGEPDLQQWVFNAPLPGFLRNSATALCLNVENCQTNVIYDYCNINGTSCGGGHGDFHPNEQWNITEDGLVRSQLPGSPCLTVLPSGDADLQPCQSPIPSTQKWTYSGGTLVTGAGMCLTAPEQNPPPPSLTLGRPLTNNRFALLFLNNSPTAHTVSCMQSCLALLQVPSGVKYTVRDLWLHQDVATGVTLESGVTVSLPGGGASVVLTLTPMVGLE